MGLRPSGFKPSVLVTTEQFPCTLCTSRERDGICEYDAELADPLGSRRQSVWSTCPDLFTHGQSIDQPRLTTKVHGRSDQNISKTKRNPRIEERRVGKESR